MTKKLNWRPSTQKPETDELIKATIAVEGTCGWFLYSGYIWRPNIGWRHERTSTPPRETNFMWIPESEITETIQPPERRNTMDTITALSLPAIGAPLLGGFYAGLFDLDNEIHALIVSPKAQGQFAGVEWGEYGQSIDATSCFDGHANTHAMAATGNKTAASILALSIAGNDEGLWYIPSRDELEICYRNLKPTSQKNYCSYRDGDNPSSAPVGYPYTAENPAQTSAELFQADGAEAFDTAWYWSSTQYSAINAYVQHFDAGSQDGTRKGNGCRVRAVRRVSVL